ncbi:hypothetical protein SLEP1_g44817 [Rubroshorea leprosula]|uniref:Fibronectin type III-like domain-containing protein n=1 Tax=Rubroshorea leprosula TaxID=152421 RepID=A0AAV5LHR4_9ROSI|nr:hypothetical protein SLEP1_g44817 [Rubroshorea leprosula]
MSSVLFFFLSFLCFPFTRSPAFAEKLPPFACDIARHKELASFRFCNASLGVEERVSDLVGRLTLSEKIGFLVNSNENVSRLGIPQYQWWSEALHGVATGGATNFDGVIKGATSFPQVILTAATFNISLFEEIGRVVSTEARAMYIVAQTGLTFWAPNVNIFRDPRWGRGQETPGEDPLLSSRYAVAFVKGLQQMDNGDPNLLKMAACCKHYTAYDLESWRGIERYSFNAVVTRQDMEDTFQPPFKSCVIDGNVASVMCSYNQVNGKPACGDPHLLGGVIRGQWKLNGYIVSDCDSVSVLYSSQNYTKTPEEAVAVAILSGLDLDCGTFVSEHAEAALKQGLIKESDIDKALYNSFATLMRVGFFNGDPRHGPYGKLGPKDVCTPENQDLAREAARQGIVLLKNSEGSLPLSSTAIKTLAVIGPNANASETMLGDYKGVPCNYITPLQGLSALVTTTYQPGCSNVTCNTVQLDEAKKIAASADATVLVMGEDQSIETEGLDRDNLLLPGNQTLLVTEVAKVAKGPVILLIMSGGGFDITFAKNDDKITSILWVGYPGEAGGGAIADIIFGYYNPCGRLPITWYPQSFVDKVPMTIMNMRPDLLRGYPGRSYRFYTGETVYPFGYGLSYSKFSYQLLKAPKLVSIPLEDNHACRLSECISIDATEQNCQNLAFDIHIKVQNTGMSGSHTILLFSTPPSVHNSPKKQLLGFEKVFLNGETGALVRFKVDACRDLSVTDEVGERKIALGKHELHVGSLKHSLVVSI